MCDCERAQELISLSLDRELTADERAELDAHTRDCTACAGMLSVLSVVSRAMAEDAEPPATLREGVMDAVRAINAEKKPKKAKIVWLRWASLAAALAIVSFAGYRLLAPGETATAPLMKAADENVSYSMNTAPAEAFDADTTEAEPEAEEPSEPNASQDMLGTALFMFPAAPDEEPSAPNSVDMEQAMNELIDAAEEKAGWKAYIVHCSVDDNAEVIELCQSLGAEIVYEYDTLGGCAVRIAPESADDLLAALSENEHVLAVSEDSSFELN